MNPITLDETTLEIYSHLLDFVRNGYGFRDVQVGIGTQFYKEYGTKEFYLNRIFIRHVIPNARDTIIDEVTWRPQENIIQFMGSDSQKMEKYLLKNMPQLEKLVSKDRSHYI